MVQGLAFLSKKSWHTKNLANQEKVWMAEQRKAAEETKTKELARQIQQEREQDELDRIAGKKSSVIDRGIDWMYQGGGAGKDKSEVEQQDEWNRQEQFLLGKEYAPQGATTGDFAQAADAKEGVNAVVATVAAAVPVAVAAAGHYNAEPSVAERNEAFRQRVEDPMFMVGQKEREKKVAAHKQQALYERVGIKTAPAAMNSSAKLSKKERKRERKERKKREKEERKTEKKKRPHDSDDEYYSDDDSISASSRGQDRHRRKRHKEQKHRPKDDEKYDDSSSTSNFDDSYDSDRDDRRRRHRSSSREYDQRRHSKSDRRRHGRHGSSRSRSRSRERSSLASRGRLAPDRDNDYRRNHHHHHHSSRDTNEPHQRRYKDQDYRPSGSHHGHQQRDADHRAHRGDDAQHHPRNDEPPTKKYGLQGAAPSRPQSNNGSLGPDEQLLHQKRKAAEEERRRHRDRQQRRPHYRQSAEERDRALEEMRQAAHQRHDVRKQQSKKDGNVDEDDGNAHDQGVGKASFLKDLTERTHGLKGDGAAQSLSSRMAQNRNTSQRLHDSSFL